MNNREELQKLLIELNGNSNVYYQPPETIKIKYPAIIYHKDYIKTDKADNSKYLKHVRYKVTVVNTLPDSEVIDKLLELPNSSFDRHYTSNNMNHDVIILYY